MGFGQSFLGGVLANHLCDRVLHTSNYIAGKIEADNDVDADSDLDTTVERLLRWSVLDDDQSVAPETLATDDTLTLAASPAVDGVESDSTVVGGDVSVDTQRQRLGRRRIYTSKLKLLVVQELKAAGNVASLAQKHSIKCRGSIYNWAKQEAAVIAACGSKKQSMVTLGGQGRPVIFPHEDEVRCWIKDLRREDFPVKTSHVVVYMAEEYEEWTKAYLETNKEDSLHRLVRRLAQRHGFSFKKPHIQHFQ